MQINKKLQTLEILRNILDGAISQLEVIIQDRSIVKPGDDNNHNVVLTTVEIPTFETNYKVSNEAGCLINGVEHSNCIQECSCGE